MKTAILDSLLSKFGISRRAVWVATIGAGVCAGAGGYTFVYAHGLSYISDNPAVCANCHVMQEYYDGWVKASHHSAATCNDCHTPHSLAAKYMTKAENGFHHSKAFTLRDFKDTIRIREKNSRILERNCLRCHQEMVSGILRHDGGKDGVPDCVRCHGGVGHGIE